MAVCLYMLPAGAPWYTSYVLVFNMLVGPVFSAASMTSERERQTLDVVEQRHPQVEDETLADPRRQVALQQ